MVLPQGENQPFKTLERINTLNPKAYQFIQKIGNGCMDFNIPAKLPEIWVRVGVESNEESVVEQAAVSYGGQISKYGWQRSNNSHRPKSLATFIFPSTPN